MLNFTILPPLSLYIHYPWCVQKCPYCDFNSHTSSCHTSQQRDQNYIHTLISDLEHELPSVWGRTVQSIFIGGGTPSLIQPKHLQQLLSAIHARIKVSPMAEITMEANPGTVDQVKFSEFRDVGINRLSIGIQSFNDQLLKKIGRIHNAQQARQAIERAKQSGFDNINLDLMYALPNQTLDDALSDIQQAINFDTSHLSHYQLTLEPNTLFAHQPPKLPNDDLSYDMQIKCQQLLTQAGFEHYEVSAYAQKNQQCRHNLNYWQFGDYLGIGAGAHGKISDAFQQTITRRWKEKHPLSYMGENIREEKQQQSSTNIENSSMIGGEQILSEQDIGFEFMLNSSRLINGFDSPLFFSHTGLPLTQIKPELNKAVELGLIQWHQNHIKPTQRGLQYLNELQELFL
ncbi:MAG: oxygen-independent coproporphyrinogen III oxidase-like protein [Gammaproteobacteria bacterium]|nr:oxygen-independent coproporphyrinogen III oxidase-like protein [Gammaproteobacteria bacterium]